MATRLSIRGAEQDPNVIDNLQRAFARMKSLPDERGYDFFASIHGLSFPAWCQHGPPLFLPWHRAYLYYFELALQTRLGAQLTIVEPQDPELADVGVPWWDWTSPESHRAGLPQSYTDVNGPLANAQIGACPGDDRPLRSGVWSTALTGLVRSALGGTISDDNPPTTLRDPNDPAELPTATEVEGALSEGTFLDFSNSLEDIHDAVHGWVGGAMSAVPTAAYDPIFWSHHAMIDRLWYLWQITVSGGDPPASLLNVVLTPFPMTVAQTLSIDDLRYEYAVQASG